MNHWKCWLINITHDDWQMFIYNPKKILLVIRVEHNITKLRLGHRQLVCVRWINLIDQISVCQPDACIRNESNEPTNQWGTTEWGNHMMIEGKMNGSVSQWNEWMNGTPWNMEKTLSKCLIVMRTAFHPVLSILQFIR